MRSVHVARDFHDPAALDDFVVTPTVRTALGQLLSGLHPNARRRAWRITGDYGTGKSALLLAAARLLAPQEPVNTPTAQALPSELAAVRPKSTPDLIPVLVTGKRADLGLTIVRALTEMPLVTAILAVAGNTNQRNAVARRRTTRKAAAADVVSTTRRTAATPRAMNDLRDTLTAVRDASEREQLDPHVVVSLLERSAIAIREAGIADGLLLVIDELGKFLEFAASSPDTRDVHLLQELAEAATRLDRATLSVVGLLHQGVQSYAEGLPPAAQREWAKVAGRFEELALAPPMSSTATLMAGALGVDKAALPVATRQTIARAWKHARALEWLPSIPADTGIDPSMLFPLHPSAVSAALAIMRRLAQNERSIFGLLLSDEPHSVATWSRGKHLHGSLYTLANLFDYVRANADIGAGLLGTGAHWARALSVVDAVVGSDPIDVAIAKAVAVLSIIEADGFRATHDTLVGALANVVIGDTMTSPESVRAAVGRLIARGVIHDRGKHAGLALWPHTSVNLRARFEESLRAVPSHPTAEAVARLLRPPPIVARRHFIRTGTLRHFAVHVVTARHIADIAIAEWPGHGPANAPYGRDDARHRPDGNVLLCVSERQVDTDVARHAATARFAHRHDVIIGFGAPIGGLADVVRTVAAWEAVLADTPALMHDEFARAEAERQFARARALLEARVRDALGLADARSVEWWCGGERMTRLPTLSELVSSACDSLYTQAPQLRHELINRRALSTAAARARLRLLEGLFENPHVPEFGLSQASMPPERSIYRSVFLRGNLHQLRQATATAEAVEDLCWTINAPDNGNAIDPLGFLPVFAALLHQFGVTETHRVPVRHLYDVLRAPPYGVRDGLTPIVLATFIASYPGRVALYETGTFLRGVDSSTFMRLMKDPRDFEMQLFPDAPAHQHLYARLAAVLHAEVSPAAQLPRTAGAVVDVVQALLRFVGNLPDYTRRTMALSESTIRVRRAIETSRDPMALLVSALPLALGTDIIADGATLPHRQVDAIVTGVATAMRELSGAYRELIARLLRAVQRAFEVEDGRTGSRAALRVMADRALTATTDTRLRGLCIRLADAALADEQWVEALASYVRERPPGRWRDEDEAAFEQELHVLANRLERATLAQAARDAGALPTTRMALVLTTGAGEERAEVVPGPEALSASTTARMQRLRAALGKPDGDGIAALSLLLWEALESKTLNPSSA